MEKDNNQDDIMSFLGVTEEDFEESSDTEEATETEKDTENPSEEIEQTEEATPENEEVPEDEFEYDVPEDILEEDEFEEQDYSEKQQELLRYLDKTVEIDGVPVDLTNLDMLDKVIERGIASIKKRDFEDTETRAITSLKENGIDLESEQMNLLVATLKGDAKACAKFITKTGLDVDIIADLVNGYDNEDVLQYKPPSYILDKSAYNMHRILDEMYQDDAGKKALDYINQWDETSKRHAADNPQLIYAVREMFRQNRQDDIERQIKYDSVFGKEAISNYDYIRFTNASEKLINNTVQRMESNAKQQAIKTRIPKTFRNKFDYKTKKVRVSNADVMSMSDEEFEEYYNNYVNRKK